MASEGDEEGEKEEETKESDPRLSVVMDYVLKTFKVWLFFKLLLNWTC